MIGRTRVLLQHNSNQHSMARCFPKGSTLPVTSAISVFSDYFCSNGLRVPAYAAEVWALDGQQLVPTIDDSGMEVGFQQICAHMNNEIFLGAGSFQITGEVLFLYQGLQL